MSNQRYAYLMKNVKKKDNQSQGNCFLEYKTVDDVQTLGRKYQFWTLVPENIKVENVHKWIINLFKITFSVYIADRYCSLFI